MKKLIFIPFLLKAFIIDDYYKFKSNDDIKNKSYYKIIDDLENIKDKDDKTYYNLANAYYKIKNYKKAISYYNKISKELLFNKYHNLGNAYAKTNQIKKAISSYEKALKIKFDKDTKYNLDLLKKIQKKQNKNNKNNKNQKNNKNKSNKKDSKKQKNNTLDKKKKDNNNKKNNISKLKKHSKKETKNKKPQKRENKTKLSDFEEKKWDKKLFRDINTLLILLK